VSFRDLDSAPLQQDPGRELGRMNTNQWSRFTITVGNGTSFRAKISSHTCTRKLSKHLIEISLIGFRGERHNFSRRIRLDPSLRSWKMDTNCWNL